MNVTKKICRRYCLVSSIAVFTILAYFMYTKQHFYKNFTSHIPPNNNGMQRIEYILNPTAFCKSAKESITVVIVVITAADNYVNRGVIRSTWGNSNITGPHIKIAYFLGTSNRKSVMEMVLEESLKYGDIIQGDFVDSYRNLTLKSVTMLGWVSQYCISAKFIFKAADDVYVHVPNLLKLALNYQNSDRELIVGRYMDQRKVVRNKNSNSFVSLEDYGEDLWPLYVQGQGYLITMAAVPELYNTSLPFVRLPIEDAIVSGVCAQLVGVKRIEVGGFLAYPFEDYSVCLNEVIVRTEVGVIEMFLLHQKVLHCLKASELNGTLPDSYLSNFDNIVSTLVSKIN